VRNGLAECICVCCAEPIIVGVGDQFHGVLEDGHIRILCSECAQLMDVLHCTVLEP
jgi:hypothetical protein